MYKTVTSLYNRTIPLHLVACSIQPEGFVQSMPHTIATVSNQSFHIRWILLVLLLTGSLFYVSLPSLAMPDANNIPLAKIIKREQQPANITPSSGNTENFAISGLDTAIATNAHKRATDKQNPWQNIIALLGVSASAWWILNTAWFKQLAQQRQGQFLAQQQHANTNTSHYSNTTKQPANNSFWFIQNSINWVKTQLLTTNSVNNPNTHTQPIANILQTVELTAGQSLVLVQVGNQILGIGTGGTQPVLLKQWEADTILPPEAAITTEENQLNTAHIPEKWMAQPPPIPSKHDTDSSTHSPLESVPDYESLNQTEAALFNQLLQPQNHG